jgi:stage 0 sporulation protein B (sporulation initiation phosphotransferase)
MEDADVVKLLQHYRHDLMNHLQIVQGYISMKKTDKADEKLKETIAYYDEERKLMYLHVPAFTLWIMQTNIMFDHIKLEYQVLTEKNLHHLDHDLTARCKKIISAVNITYGIEELFEISMEIKDAENSSFVEISFLIKGENRRETLLSGNLKSENVTVRKTPSGIVCSFLIQ